MSIDLHCHTRYSDGSTPLEELIQLAALRGVTTFALTDHDTMAGCECALELGRGAGVTVIPGVEISAAEARSVAAAAAKNDGQPPCGDATLR